ncbi:MAG: SURF1 family protein [Pseudomonadota bacterium]
MESYRFVPSLIPTLAFLVLMPLLVSLGIWQLNRADEKRALIDLQRERTNDESIRLTGAEENLEALRYRSVTATGVYDGKHQFLVDNQISRGQAGYYVMTPLKLQEHVAVLVNRGWLPAGLNRSKLPDIAISRSEVSISGKVNSFPSVGIRLRGAEIPTVGWPAVVQVVDAAHLSGVLGYKILPFQIYLDASQPQGYFREWKLRKFLNPERHTGYAVQWFALAATLAVIYVWYGVKLNSTAGRNTPQT